MKKKNISITLCEDTIRALKQIAQSKGISLSSLIEIILREKLK